jgi:hypothetical protein
MYVYASPLKLFFITKLSKKHAMERSNKYFSFMVLLLLGTALINSLPGPIKTNDESTEVDEENMVESP